MSRDSVLCVQIEFVSSFAPFGGKKRKTTKRDEHNSIIIFGRILLIFFNYIIRKAEQLPFGSSFLRLVFLFSFFMQIDMFSFFSIQFAIMMMFHDVSVLLFSSLKIITDPSGTATRIVEIKSTPVRTSTAITFRCKYINGRCWTVRSIRIECDCVGTEIR
jgi:hypothetical protein